MHQKRPPILDFSLNLTAHVSIHVKFKSAKLFTASAAFWEWHFRSATFSLLMQISEKTSYVLSQYFLIYWTCNQVRFFMSQSSPPGEQCALRTVRNLETWSKHNEDRTEIRLWMLHGLFLCKFKKIGGKTNVKENSLMEVRYQDSAQVLKKQQLRNRSLW